MSACDYSWSRPDPQALRDAGFHGVIRYATDGTSPAGKAITADEYARLRAAGLQVTLVMERGTQPALGGGPAGIRDAQEANSAADAIGYPKDCAIYYVAEDPNKLPQNQWPIVMAYFDGVASVQGRPIGAYGSQALLQYLMANRPSVKYAWQVAPWSSDTSGMHLCQQVGNVPAQFANQIDMDVILHEDWGQTPRPSPPVPGIPGDDVTPQDKQDIINGVVTPIGHALGLIEYGDSFDAATGKATQGHPFNLFQMSEVLNGVSGKVDALAKAVTALQNAPAPSVSVPAQLEADVADLKEKVSKVAVDLGSVPAPAAPAAAAETEGA